MALTRLKNGIRITLSPQEEATLLAEWAANQTDQDAHQATTDALNAQVDSEKANLPTWAQVVTAIDNAFTNTAQASIIKKIARPVYTALKKSVI